MDRERIERQLKKAEQDLVDCEKQLDKEKVAPEQRSRNAKWRHADADRRAMKRRLLAVMEIEEREAAALERKNQDPDAVAEEATAE